MTPIQRLIDWAADALATVPELGDARTREGSDILRDVCAGLRTVEYRGEQHRVPHVKLQGNYVCCCRANADCTTVLILEMPASIKPGDKATEAQCAAATPVLAVSLTNTGSLDAISAWIARVAEKMEQAARCASSSASASTWPRKAPPTAPAASSQPPSPRTTGRKTS